MRAWARTLRADVRGDAGIYILATVFLWMALGVAVAYAAIHALVVARATMSRYEQIALQQTAQQLTAIDAVQGAQGVTGDEAALLVSQDLQRLVPPAWHYHITQVHVYTQAQAGQPAPSGVPGGVIPGAGLYVSATLQWLTPVPGVGPLSIPVPEWMSANTYIQPVQQWQGG